jgi:hypothetical protein
MSDSDRGNEGMPPQPPAPPIPPAPPEPPTAPVSATPTAASAPTPNPGDSKSLATPANGSRAMMLLALLLFLLPWVTVSCANQTLVSMSGLDLARGSVAMHNPMTGENVRPPSGGGADIPVMVGAILIALALALSFVMKGRIGTLASMASLAVAAALISYTVLVRIPDQAREDAASSGTLLAPGTPGADQAQVADLIRVQTEIGFWLTLAAIIGAIILAWMVARREAPPG